MPKNISITLTLLVTAAFLLVACSGNALPLSNISAQLPAVKANPADLAAKPTPVAPGLSVDQTGLLAAYQETLQSIYEKVNPSVVNIQVVVNNPALGTNPNQMPQLPFGDPTDPQNPSPDQSPLNRGLGSGFVWDQQGHIVTNNHVVDNAVRIEVSFSDGTIAPATMVGADPYSDLAVIKVDMPVESLKPVEVADSKDVKVGQLAIAIGNPFGLEGTMTVGIISALGRSLPVGENLGLGSSFTIPEIIQTDAPINPGNSGGVLVDDQGKLIGVTAAIESPVRANAGIGFVIPSQFVQKIVPILIQSGKYDHPYLGISGATLTPDIAKAMGLDLDQRGALVSVVVPDGPADKAGVKGSDQPATIDGQEIKIGGDLIVAIDGQPIKGMDDLISYLSTNTEVGQEINLALIRAGQSIDLRVTLAARPAQNQPVEQTEQKSEPEKPAAPVAGSVWMGIIAVDMNPAIAKEMSLPSEQTGVLIQQVVPGGPADLAGLRAGTQSFTLDGQDILIGGDIITAVNGKAISQTEDLRASLQQFQVGQIVTITILRDGNQIELPVTLAERPANP